MRKNIPVTPVTKADTSAFLKVDAGSLQLTNRDSYQDSDKNIYIFDNQNRLFQYLNHNLGSTKSLENTLLKRADVQEVIINSLQKEIPLCSDFAVEAFDEGDSTYDAVLVRKVDTDIADTISATIKKDGTLDSVTVNYCNVDADHPVTQKHKHQLDVQVQKYIDQKKRRMPTFPKKRFYLVTTIGTEIRSLPATQFVTHIQAELTMQKIRPS